MTQREESDTVRVTMSWDARIIGTTEVPADWFKRGGTLDLVVTPELHTDTSSPAERLAWARMLAGYVQDHGQPWNEMTRFAVRLEGLQ